MPHVKVVIIGPSGVGKTSLRTKYTSGRFASTYRATIGTDFITKTLPHPSGNEDAEPVVLQIWDTAGQERFSTLASAFFRGADAVILVYDLAQPETLPGLTRWWDEFREKAPIEEGHECEFPVIVVGNKLDLKPFDVTDENWVQEKEAEAKQYLERLIPVPSEEEIEAREELLTGGRRTPEPRRAVIYMDGDSEDGTFKTEDIVEHPQQQPPLPNGDAASSPASDQQTSSPTSQLPTTASSSPSDDTPSGSPTRRHSPSISIAARARSSLNSSSSSRATSRTGSKYANGTVTTTNTIYHTASSSMIDNWEGQNQQQSNPGSPPNGHAIRPPASSLWPTESGTNEALSTAGGGDRIRARVASSTSASSSAPTITPGTFRLSTAIPPPSPGTLTPVSPSVLTITPKRTIPEIEYGPKLFFTSAKTGHGLSDVFEYLGKRAIAKMEWDRYVEEMEERASRERDEHRTGAGGRVTLDGENGKREPWYRCC